MKDKGCAGTNHEEEEEEEEENDIIKGTDWKSIYISGICSFIQASQFSLYLSSMWPYLKVLDPSATETMFGFIVALYSLGQCLSAPTFGYWSNRIEQVRLPLLCGFGMMLFGNLFYLSLQFLPSYHGYVMAIARLITGSGTGNMSLLRTYASTASTPQDRSRAIAIVSGGIAIGTITGPAFQLLFTPLGEEGVNILPFFNLNIYNGPALFAILMNILGLFIVNYVFKENNDLIIVSTSKDSRSLADADGIGLGVCIATRFSQIFVSTSIETIFSAYTMMMFSLDKETAVHYSAISHGITGVIGASIYFTFITFSFTKSIRLRSTCIITLSMYIIFYLLTYPYEFSLERVPLQINGSDAGCVSDRFDWCQTLPTLSPYLFYCSMTIVFGVGGSLLNIALPTLFSKIIGPRRQGTHQGVFQLSGSIGRLIAPVIASSAYTVAGPKAVWKIEIAEISLVMAIWIVCYRRMISFEKRVAKL